MDRSIKMLLLVLSSAGAFNSNAQPVAKDYGAAQSDIRQGDPAPAPDEAIIYPSVDAQASFPGGIAKWSAFLQGNLRYPQDAIEQEIQGQVMLSFIVHPDGTLSDIEAISGPELLRAEALRVLQLSPKWIAAQKNGQPVLFRQKQPIRFVLEGEVSEEHSGKRP